MDSRAPQKSVKEFYLHAHARAHTHTHTRAHTHTNTHTHFFANPEYMKHNLLLTVKTTQKQKCCVPASVLSISLPFRKFS